MKLKIRNAEITVDFDKSEIVSLVIDGKERICGACPLFRVGLRDQCGDLTVLSAKDASVIRSTDIGAEYAGFTAEGLPDSFDITVAVSLLERNGEAEWKISVTPTGDEMLIEWVDFPLAVVQKLKAQCDDGGKVLLPYNEGVLISDWELRNSSVYPYCAPGYPSEGWYMVFPNMMFAQMQAYLWDDVGLYVGAHDSKRGVKGIDFYQNDDGVVMQLRLFCGVDFGEAFEPSYPIVWSVIGPSWESAAERYRTFFETNLPFGVKKIVENEALPEWYESSPLVIGYPVRGTYDRGDMTPNRMYPYTNALPKLDAIKNRIDSRLLVLLMHWEGTAPWAPPYVMPPFGDVENFDLFRKTLQDRGDLLGVYCSGFSYTIQSCMIPEYNKQEVFDREGLADGMCAAPDGQVQMSTVCTLQRSGYDICPASEIGRNILKEAYEPLFKSGLDYAQILDQNHGGSQYFCYSRKHGHPPAPGEWMTRNMQELLGEWNALAGKMLLGCESAAAEPYVGNLLLSDNRYELNYRLGIPVPLYSYIYHQYVRNFMGNQVGCPLREQDDEHLLYRLGYSFSIGDCMTLILNQDGYIKSRWGRPKIDYEYVPDQESILRLVKNLTDFYKKEAKPYLYSGRMIPSPAVECEPVEFLRYDSERTVVLPSVLTSAWESDDGKRAQILVNPNDREVSCLIDGRTYSIPPLMAKILNI